MFVREEDEILEEEETNNTDEVKSEEDNFEEDFMEEEEFTSDEKKETELEDVMDEEASEQEATDSESNVEEEKKIEDVSDEETPNEEEPVNEENLSDAGQEENVQEPEKDDLENTKEFDQAAVADKLEDKSGSGKKKIILLIVAVLLIIGGALFALGVFEKEEEEEKEEEILSLETAVANLQAADNYTLTLNFHEYDEDDFVVREEIMVRYDFVADVVSVVYEEDQMFFSGIQAGEPYDYYLDDEGEWDRQEIVDDAFAEMQTIFMEGIFIENLVDYEELFHYDEEEETYFWENDEIGFSLFAVDFDPTIEEEAMAEIGIVVGEEYVDTINVKLVVDEEHLEKITMTYTDINETEVTLPEIEEEEEPDLSQEESSFYFIAQLYLQAAETEYYRRALNDNEELGFEARFPYQPNGVFLDVNEPEPLGGGIVVVDEDIIYMAFYNNYFCAYKSYDTDVITLVNLQDLPAGVQCSVTGLTDTGNDNPPFNVYVPEENDEEEEEDDEEEEAEENNDEETD